MHWTSELVIPSRVPSRREHGDARRRPCPPSLKSLALAGRIAAATLTALFLIPAAASAQDSAAAVDPPPDQPASATAAPDNLSRWVDLQTANVLGRFRYVENSAHVVTARQLQDSLSLRARLKLDRGARLSVTGAAATGTSFTGSWNNTGIGTGDPVHALSVKQLYFGAVPWGGVEVSYGGLAPIRGESTEITSYDNDGYMVGERVSLRRPKDLFFDEISATAGFLGDVETPNVFRRLDRLGEINYGQILASKKATSWLTASADVTRVSNVSTVRAAATVGVAASNILDTVRYEQYARTGEDAAFGYAVTAEKALGRRLTAGLGYADIDQNYGGLNGDRYGSGRRLFETGGIRLWSALSLAMFATQAFHDDVAISNHQRVDVVLTYNVLATLKRAGLIR